MNNILKRVGVLAAVFVVALLVFSKTLNHEPEDMTADMEAAGLPVVYMMKNQTRLSELHGYVKDMDAVTMGEDITPLPDDNVLEIQVDTYGNELNALSYEVRSLDGQRLIQDGADLAFELQDDTAMAQIPLQDLLQAETEYLLILHLEQAGGQTHYYTKLMKEEGCDNDECVAFVMDFHQKTLDKDQSADLSMFLEPNADADNATLQHVTIQNRLRQVAWGNLEVTEVTEPVVAVQEMNEDYNVILLTTTVSAMNENGTTDYYNVKEYYRVRQGIERMYLLDYERSVEEIFQGTTGNISNNYIQLGIRSQEVDYWSSETGTNVCFVQEGDLWNYNQATNQLVQVYTFRSSTAVDVRENYSQHDIRIINADETGGIDFIVYGYMNRGEHEGEVGISVCHYDSVTNTVEEYLFLPTTVSYDVLKQSISQLLYINDDRMFYLMLGDGIYAIDLDTKEYEEILSGLAEGSCQVSENGRYVAWVDPAKVNTATVLNVMDLKSGVTTQTQAREGSCIKPLGFVDTDCIYGLADMTSAGGNFVTDTLIISQITADGLEELTSYSKGGLWIRGVEVEDGIVRISLARIGQSEESLTDTITNKEMQESLRAQIETYSTELKQRQVRIVLAETVQEKAPIIKTPKLMLSEESTTLILDQAVFVK